MPDYYYELRHQQTEEPTPIPTHRPPTGRDSPMSLGACPALDASVLVLNKCYLAVHIIPVRRAFCLLFKELAEVITLADGRYLSHDFQTWREVSEEHRHRAGVRFSIVEEPHRVVA